MNRIIDCWNGETVYKIASSYRNIYIYGAGDWARRFFIWCKRNRLSVDKVLVSDMKDNPCHLFGCFVFAFHDVEIEDNDLIIVAVQGNIGNQIYTELSSVQSNDIWLVSKLPKMVEGSDFYSVLETDELKFVIPYSFNQDGHFLDINNPITFNEKIQWLKVCGDIPFMAKLADKYLAKEYIAETVGNNYNIQLLGVWEKAEDIDFDELPSQFVLKCNHGCGYNIIVKNKNEFDTNEARKRLNKWLEEDYGSKGAFEIHYSLINRKIIAEEYIEQIDGGLYDYKIHCFNGKPRFIQLIGDRDLIKHDGRQVVLDVDWNVQEWSFGDYPRYEKSISAPLCLKEMIDVAAKLAKGTIYVRVDLYVIDNSIKVGELTFTPAGGYYKYNSDWSYDVNYMLGQLIELPIKH